jgi:hypothetical protein
VCVSAVGNLCSWDVLARDTCTEYICESRASFWPFTSHSNYLSTLSTSVVDPHYIDADPDTDFNLMRRLKPLKKGSNTLIFHTVELVFQHSNCESTLSATYFQTGVQKDDLFHTLLQFSLHAVSSQSTTELTRGPPELFSTFVYRESSHRCKSAACPKSDMVWLNRLSISLGRRWVLVISSF